MDNACLFVKVNASSLYTILRGNILTKSKKMLIRFISKEINLYTIHRSTNEPLRADYASIYSKSAKNSIATVFFKSLSFKKKSLSIERTDTI